MRASIDWSLAMASTSDTLFPDRDALELGQLRRDRSRPLNLGDRLPGTSTQCVLTPDGTDAIAQVSPGSRALWGVTPETVHDELTLPWAAIHPDGVQGMHEAIECQA